MKIKEMLSKKELTLSFEVFPPKRDGNLEELFDVVGRLKKLNPDFISVTYGAGGSNKDNALEIAYFIKNNFNLEILSHLTCVQTTKREMEKIIKEFEEAGIENILALRGDPPKGTEKFEKFENGFDYANELVSFIRAMNGFCIGAACYPHGHSEAKSKEEDMINLKRKVDAGTDFLITQLFFDNEEFYKFCEVAKKEKIDVPIIPGIMSITSYKQIKRITELSGHKLPYSLDEKIERLSNNPEEIEKYGIEYAIRQSQDLIKNKVRGIHFYCMNKSEPVSQIVEGLNLKR